MSKLPSSYTVFGTANNGNQLTAIRSNSSTAKPRLLILDRSDAVYNAKTQTYSVPDLRLRLLVGTVDSDGNPKPERLLVDVNFRTPIGSETDHAEWFNDLKGILADPDFLAEVIQKHMFPCCAAPTP